jgi:PhoH-like ATPase
MEDRSQMPDSRKTFVLDTSVLLSAPRAPFAFAEHHVVLPLVVINELEAKKDDPELGKPAREALRLLEGLRVADNGHLPDGVPVGTQGGTVRIEINHIEVSGLPVTLQRNPSNDTKILAVALNLASDGRDVVLVSKDVAMRIKADVVGVVAQEYLHEQVRVSDAYTGLMAIDAPSEIVDVLHKEGAVDLDALDVEVPVRHTGVTVGRGALARVGIHPKTGEKALVKVNGSISAWDVQGRSAEQRIALAHLLDPEIGIVSLGGAAGTGKSLLALAAALEIVLEGKGPQKRIIVFRPLYSVGGQDLGYLPGTEEEKMMPWAGAVYDAFKFLDPQGEAMARLQDQKAFEVLPLTHVRGRTFTDSIVIVDEAQNLERQTLLTALSRLGTNSRVFLTHDVAQRDNLRVGRHDGGDAVVETLKGHPLFAHMTLTRSERSPIAALVSELLDDLQ